MEWENVANMLLQRIKSLESFFNPKSVAVIGASLDTVKPSGRPLIALKNSGYKGKLFAVNSQYQELFGVKCYASVMDIPEEIELALVVVPSSKTLDILKECISKNVKAAIVIASGFAEIGEEGKLIQGQISNLALRSSMRICGPNTTGIISTPYRMVANFAVDSLPDSISLPNFAGLITQSGGFGYAIYEMIQNYGIGCSYFINSGNEADVDFSDYLAYLAKDTYTKVVSGYMEGVKNGSKFIEASGIALAEGKPVVLMKTGRSADAAKAAASHTGALTGSDRVYDAVFRQKGIIRVESFHEMLAVLNVLVGEKLPCGNKIAIITTSGGSGVFVTDKCKENGLSLARLSYSTRQKLERMLPSFASVDNPVDITSAVMVNPSLIIECARVIAEEPDVDIITIVYKVNTDEGRITDFVSEMANFVNSASKPVVNLIWGHQEHVQNTVRSLVERKAPAIGEIEYGIKALALLAGYMKKKQAKGTGSTLIIEPEAKETAASVLDNLPNGAVLTEHESKKILAVYGIPVTREELVTDAEAAVEAAMRIGYPVVLKIESPDILHKTEVSGIRLNIKTPEEVKSAFVEIQENVKLHKPHASIKGMLVQEMLSQGLEVIIGIGRDNVFGPTVMFGLGGVFVEVFKDISLRVPPLSMEEALEMIEEIKGRRLIEGFRDMPAVDKKALAEIIMRIAQLALDFPGIAELDINPLICTVDGIKASDALIIYRK